MSRQAVSNKVRYEKEKAAFRLQPAFPAAVEEDSDLIDELPHLECARSNLPDPRSQEHVRHFTKPAVGLSRVTRFSVSLLDSRLTNATHAVLPASAMAACDTMFGQP